MADLFKKVVDSFVRKNNWSKAAQQQHFKRIYNVFDRQGDKYRKQDIPAATDMKDVTTISAAEFQKQTTHYNTFVHNTEPQKINRLKVWRDMSFFPEISFIVGDMVDEVINFDTNNEFAQLKIKNYRLKNNENIMANLAKEFKYILIDIMNAPENVNGWFEEFLIDAEFAMEKIIDPTAPKERGIVGVKKLCPEFAHPIWEDINSDKVYEFIYKDDGRIVKLPAEAVAYVNSGLYYKQDRYTKIPVSILERGKVDYRKLKQMEDALVIYRLIRAPERRVFKIEVGKLPKPKAEAYVKELMRKYRQRKTFNPETGEAGEMYDPQAMIEDFFFPQQDGRGSSVDTLPGGENLGQIDDVLYFLKKLYKSLRYPSSRIDEQSGFSLGDTSDITRDEVRFHKMMSKFSTRFAQLFKQIFMTHIRLKGYADEYNIQERDIDIEILGNNLFQDYLESNVITLRTEIVERLMPHTEGDETNPPLLAKKFVRNYLKLTPEQIAENEQLLKEQLAKGGVGGGESSGGGGGGLGGLGGGSSGGGGGSSSGGSEMDLGDLGGDEGGEDVASAGADESAAESPSDEGDLTASDLESFT